MGDRVHRLARRGWFYWRARMPPVLASRIGRSHSGNALRTSDRAVARGLAARATAAVEALGEAVTMTAQEPIQPTDAELMEILRQMVRAIIVRGEREHLFRPENHDPDAISDDDTEEEAEAEALDDPTDLAHDWRGVLVRNAFEEIRPYTQGALRRRNRAAPEPEERHRSLPRMAAGVAAEAPAILAHARMGTPRPAVFPHEGWPGPSVIAEEGKAGASRPSLSALFAQHAKRQGWGRANAHKAAVAPCLFRGRVGDPPASAITRRDAATFKHRLEVLPATWAQAAIYREAAKAGDLGRRHQDGQGAARHARANPIRRRTMATDDHRDPAIIASHTTTRTNRGPMADALEPLRRRIRRPVREREVLRVAASIDAQEPQAALEEARRSVLAWAKTRCGSDLPNGAWQGESFELITPGRTTLAARLTCDGIDLWALRGDDPDKTVAGRIWTTEVALGHEQGQATQISLRLLVASPEEEPEFDPAAPGLLRQIAHRFRMLAGGFALSDAPWRIASEEDLDRLVAMLEAPSRRLPVFLASGDARGPDPDEPLIDAEALARTTIGLAHVVVVPARFTYGLSDAFGKLRSCYHGAVRVYLPGFDSAADPFEHPLALGDVVRRDPRACAARLRHLAAKESLRRLRLGRDVVAFASVRSTALQIERETEASVRTSDGERLEHALRQIEALQGEVAEKQAEAEQAFDLARQEEERAKVAETQLHHARERIRQLEARLAAKGQRPDEGVEAPPSWREFADWCDQALAGRVALAPGARQGIKKAEFEDVALAARCLLWLASECRDRLMNGGGSIANVPIEQGIENAPCGGDAFRFDFRGRRLQADWHIKNGGNTRDPGRCLRIYYAWDETTQEIVIADMPAHRRTGAT